MPRRTHASAFSRELLKRMMRARALEEHGDPDTRTSPFRRPWQHNLHPALRAHTEGLLANGLDLHDYAHALNSSQCFALNLFLPFAVGSASGLGLFLSERLGREVHVLGVDVEYFGSGDLLAEIPGTEPREDEHLTAADVAIHLEDARGQRGVVLIEVKLTEAGFTPCGGRHSRGNRDDAACRSRALLFDMPHRCYLQRPFRARRDRRYWALFTEEHGSLGDAFPGAKMSGCPFETNWQQPMRNHALALAHTQSGRASFWAFALVHHDDNPDVTPPWEAYRAATVDAPHLHRWPASTLMDALATALPDKSPELVSWLRERYFLGGT